MWVLSLEDVASPPFLTHTPFSDFDHLVWPLSLGGVVVGRCVSSLSSPVTFRSAPAGGERALCARRLAESVLDVLVVAAFLRLERRRAS